MVGNKIVLISRFHVTELCSVGKCLLYVWIVISSAVVGDESNVRIIAVTACWVICQKTSDFYESPNLSGVVIIWADLEGGAGRILECFWSFLKWSSSFLFLLHQIPHINWAKTCSHPLTEAGNSQRSQSLCFLRWSMDFGGNWEDRKFHLKRFESTLSYLWRKYFCSGKGHISHSCGEFLNVKTNTDSKKCSPVWYFCSFHAARWFVEILWLTLFVM